MMSIYAWVSGLPQPISSLIRAWAIACTVTLTAILFGAGELALVPFALVIIATGVVLAFNVNGSASEFAKSGKQQAPLGIDYSQSWLASTAYARVFGVVSVIVGSGLLITAIW